MARIACVLSVTCLLGWSGSASAKDFCLGTVGAVTSAYVFQNVHIPKPGRTTALIGAYIFRSNELTVRAPLNGTIYRDASDGKLMIGAFVHAMLHNVPGSSFTMTWEADPATLEGTAAFDVTGDMNEDPGDSITLISVSCKSIQMP
jgi:hypothetical protein